MALTPTVSALTSVSDTDGGTSTSTSSVLPTAKRYLVVVCGSAMNSGSITPNTPTISGCSQTWTSITNKVIATNVKISIHGCVVASPTSGAITADFAGQSQDVTALSVFQVDAGDASYTPKLVQSATATSPLITTDGLTVALAAFEDATNGVSIGGVILPAAEAITEGVGYTQIHDFSTANHKVIQLATEYKVGDDDPDWTWTDVMASGVAIEVGWTTGASGVLQGGRLVKGGLLMRGRLL